MTPQERAHALNRVEKKEYTEGIHPQYTRNKEGKVVVNPTYLDSLSYISGWQPFSNTGREPMDTTVDVDAMMDDQGLAPLGYEPDLDAKRMSATVREKYEAEGITPKQRAEVEKKRQEREVRLDELGQMFGEAGRAARDRAYEIRDLQNPSNEQIETLRRAVSDDIERQEVLRGELSSEFKTLYWGSLDHFPPWSGWSHWNAEGLESLRAHEPSGFESFDSGESFGWGQVDNEG
jgi:hypothetical protein